MSKRREAASGLGPDVPLPHPRPDCVLQLQQPSHLLQPRVMLTEYAPCHRLPALMLSPARLPVHCISAVCMAMPVARHWLPLLVNETWLKRSRLSWSASPPVVYPAVKREYSSVPMNTHSASAVLTNRTRSRLWIRPYRQFLPAKKKNVMLEDTEAVNSGHAESCKVCASWPPVVHAAQMNCPPYRHTSAAAPTTRWPAFLRAGLALQSDEGPLSDSVQTPLSSTPTASRSLPNNDVYIDSAPARRCTSCCRCFTLCFSAYLRPGACRRGLVHSRWPLFSHVRIDDLLARMHASLPIHFVGQARVPTLHRSAIPSHSSIKRLRESRMQVSWCLRLTHVLFRSLPRQLQTTYAWDAALVRRSALSSSRLRQLLGPRRRFAVAPACSGSQIRCERRKIGKRSAFRLWIPSPWKTARNAQEYAKVSGAQRRPLFENGSPASALLLGHSPRRSGQLPLAWLPNR